MGIENSKTWVANCDECGEEYDDLAVFKSDFAGTLESIGWKVTQHGNRTICPECQKGDKK